MRRAFSLPQIGDRHSFHMLFVLSGSLLATTAYFVIDQTNLPPDERAHFKTKAMEEKEARDRLAMAERLDKA